MSQDKTEEETSKNNSEVEENIDEETSKNEESTDEDVVDYKAELERERKIREKAESDRDNYKKGMLKAKKKAPKKEVDDWDNDDDEEADIDQEELISRKVKETVSKESRKISNQLRSSQVDDYLDNISSSNDEKELIKFHLEHTIVPSGSLKRDIQDAQLIANRKKLFTENNELKLALKTRDSIRNSSVGSGVNTNNKSTAEAREAKKLLEKARYEGTPEAWAEVLSKRLTK